MLKHLALLSLMTRTKIGLHLRNWGRRQVTKNIIMGLGLTVIRTTRTHTTFENSSEFSEKKYTVHILSSIMMPPM